MTFPKPATAQRLALSEAPPRAWAQRGARGVLLLFLFIIPFSNAAIEILFFPLFLTWIIGWHFPNSEPSGAWRSTAGRNILLALLCYLAVCSFSVPISTHPMHSLIGLFGKTFEYALFFLMAGDIANSPSVVQKGGKVLLLAAGWVGIYAVYQEWLISRVPGLVIDPIIPLPLLYSKMVGPYRNPNDLATFLMVTLLILIAHLFDRPRVPQWHKWFLGLLLVGCLVRTTSRGAFLGFSAGLLFLLFFFPRQKWIRVGSAGMLVIVLILILAGKTSLKEVLFFSDRASLERRAMWNTAWSMIEARPILGHGLNTFMANYQSYAVTPTQGPAYAHNCFLQIAAETGILGLGFFLWFLALLLRSLWRSLRAHFDLQTSSVRAWLMGFTAALIAFLVQSAFDTQLYSLRQATLFWTLAGFSFGASRCLKSSVS